MTERYTTTDGGAPAPSDEQSLTIGPDGPILLQDHYLLEQMAQFNRERIPERQPHAKGGGAFGHFEVTNDVSKYTRAAVFQPGTKTDTLIRFSTVAGERGSPDTWRDPRGFSLKFYVFFSTSSTAASPQALSLRASTRSSWRIRLVVAVDPWPSSSSGSSSA